MEDIYPGEEWNYVFGQAKPMERVGNSFGIVRIRARQPSAYDINTSCRKSSQPSSDFPHVLAFISAKPPHPWTTVSKGPVIINESFLVLMQSYDKRTTDTPRVQVLRCFLLRAALTVLLQRFACFAGAPRMRGIARRPGLRPAR